MTQGSPFISAIVDQAFWNFFSWEFLLMVDLCDLVIIQWGNFAILEWESYVDHKYKRCVHLTSEKSAILKCEKRPS